MKDYITPTDFLRALGGEPDADDLRKEREIWAEREEYDLYDG